MTAHECLLHPWLTGDHTKTSDRFAKIDSSKYINFRDNIRTKYDNWDSFTLPIGRLSEYSSLRKLLIEKYRIQDTSFGKTTSFIVDSWFSLLLSLYPIFVFLQIVDKQLQGLS